MVATQNLGALGAAEGKPVAVEWRWYYSLPSLPLWVLLLLLAVVPKHNRNIQASLVLLLPLLAAGLSFLMQQLLPDSSGADGFGLFLVALAIAWASVWLVGPWLRRRDPMRSTLAALAVMFGVGAVGYMGYFGLWVSGDVTGALFGVWAVSCVSLVAATALTGLCCRGQCSPSRLLVWPMLWLPVFCGVCGTIMMTVVFVLVERGGGGGPGEMLFAFAAIAMQVLMGSTVGAGLLYVFDLPVNLLRTFSPIYRERFRGLFCRSDAPLQELLRTADKLAGDGVATTPFRA